MVPNKTPEAGFGDRKHSGESSGEKEAVSGRKKEALAYLLETGRAQTPEEAEFYLDSLNRLKERLLVFLQDIHRKEQARPRDWPSPAVRIGDAYAYPYGGPPEKADHEIAALTASDIDINDPHIWALTRTVGPGGYELDDALVVRLQHRHLLLRPDLSDDLTVLRLRQFLSQEEIDLLVKEYESAHRDMANDLRHIADEVAATHDFELRQWKCLQKK